MFKNLKIKQVNMDRLVLRSFLSFFCLLLICASTLVYAIVSGDKAIKKTTDLVDHSYQIITEAQRLSILFEAMHSNQRGYLIVGDQAFLDIYEEEKNEVSDRIARLSALAADNNSQQSRLHEMRMYFAGFIKELDSRIERFRQTSDLSFLRDLTVIDGLKENIVRVNDAFLREEYRILNDRISVLENKKNQYYSSLLIGIFVGTALLLLFNGFLLQAQRRRSKIEASLRDTEQRFALAIDGTQDGIFDWDITGKKIFYSGRFFEMLGYERKAYSGLESETRSFIHPDDLPRVTNHTNDYLNKRVNEYSQEFRLKHRSGRWLWVQSRGKALFDKNGTAYRMVGSYIDVTHIKQKQERLVSEKVKAEEANRAKGEFLAHMSHEIRTPLTAISGIAEILQKNQANLTHKQTQLVRTLASSTSVLKETITDILDFSKIESGEVSLNNEDFIFDNLFEDVISMMALRASEKKINFVFDYSDVCGHQFHGDKLRLRQILVNLLGNAVKFTEEGGIKTEVSIENRNNQNFMRIDVTDTGIGVASEDLDLIFDPFKQADSSVSRKFGGTGLGLPISRNLARLMGGDIYVNSQPGKGTTFTLIVPYTHGIHKPRALPPSLDHSEALSRKIQTLTNRSTRVLIAEDYEGNIVVFTHMMDDLGIKYDVARTGLEAVNAWKKNHYDFIFMDVQMPEMDGFTATQEIRRLEPTRGPERTPIIGITAHALVEDRDKCIEAGMDAYLAKPIIEDDLKSCMLRFMKEPQDIKTSLAA